MPAAGAGALLVHGYAGDYGALNYLTGFVPKLDQALALLPLEGGIRLIVSGTELMIPQAKLLTWVEDVRPFANVPKLVADWLGANKALSRSRAWGAGSMAHGIHRGITAAVGPLMPLDDTLDPIRRRKSPRELELMRRASEILGGDAGARGGRARRRRRALGGARGRTRGHRRGRAGRTRAREPHAGRRAAAARRRRGSCTRSAARDGRGAVRGLLGRGQRHGDGARRPGARRAPRRRLPALLAEARPGATGASLRAVAAQKLAPMTLHPALGGRIGGAIGLSLDEGPLDDDAALEPGATYALRVGAAGEGGDAALVSAMIAVGDTATSVLWASPRIGVRMTAGRVAAAVRFLEERGLDALLAFNNAQNSFLDSNAVFVLSGGRPIGPSAVLIDRGGKASLILTPAWDEARAAALAPGYKIVASDDLPDALARALGAASRRSAAAGHRGAGDDGPRACANGSKKRWAARRPPPTNSRAIWRACAARTRLPRRAARHRSHSPDTGACARSRGRACANSSWRPSSIAT